jgi:hemolysin activation/secretion protein
MASFTGRLGTDTSQLGNLELGTAGVSTVSASLTADAVLRRSQSASFSVDAQITLGTSTVSTSFTADAVITTSVTISTSFTADASLVKIQNASFTANAVIKRSQTASLTANSVIRRTQTASFTANASINAHRSASFAADAVILGLFIQQHDRWTTHTGIDHGVDHILARPIGTFMRGTNLMDVLIDMDARLTAKEQQKALRLTALTLDAVIV